MRYTLAALAILLMTGCASTSKTAAVADARRGEAPQSRPAATPAPNTSAAAAPADALKVAEVKHDGLDTLAMEPASPRTAYQGFEPYQCVMAWARDMQQNLNPWLKTCDTRTQKN